MDQNTTSVTTRVFKGVEISGTGIVYKFGELGNKEHFSAACRLENDGKLSTIIILSENLYTWEEVSPEEIPAQVLKYYASTPELQQNG